MRTRDVPQEQWKPFLSGFTDQHRGDSVHLETVGGGEGPRSILSGTPLMKITAAEEEDRIEVTTGAASDSRTHRIGHPTHLSVSESDDGNPLGVQITAEDGCVTCLRVDPSDMHEVPPGYYLG